MGVVRISREPTKCKHYQKGYKCMLTDSVCIMYQGKYCKRYEKSKEKRFTFGINDYLVQKSIGGIENG